MLSLRLSILLFRFSNCYHPWVSQAPFRLCGFSSGDSPSPVSIRFRMLIRYSIYLSIYQPASQPRTSLVKFARSPRTVVRIFIFFSLSRLCVLYVETLTGVLFWSFDLLGNIFEQLVFHLRPSPDHYYYYYPQYRRVILLLRFLCHSSRRLVFVFACRFLA